MGIGRELSDYLKQHEDVNAKVDNRIYPMRFPDDPTFPLITYHRITAPQLHDIGVNYPTYQFSCWAERYGQAEEVAEIIKEALNGFKGYLGDQPIKRIVYTNLNEMYDEGSKLYHFPVEVKIIYF